MTQIRQATPHDAGQIAEIQQLVWTSERIDIAQIIRGLTDANHTTLVSVDPVGEILGFADGFRTQAKDNAWRWEIDLVAVAPKAQGRGIGRHLVDALTTVGQEKNSQFARALVQVENHAMHRTLTSLGYTCEPAHLHLFVSEPLEGISPEKPVNLHIVPVNTLAYKGVWIEDDWSAESFQHCQTQLTHTEVAGTLIPSSNMAGIEHAKQSGFTKIEDYQWWIWHY